MEATTARDQLVLFKKDKRKQKYSFVDPSFASNKEAPVHRWIPWIAGFSADFVQDAIDTYLASEGTVLDPFAGVGTTLVEALRAGHSAVGFEINPYAALASETKIAAAATNPDRLEHAVDGLNAFFAEALNSGREPQSTPPEGFRTRADFYSPKVLRKVLFIWDYIGEIEDAGINRVFRLAFAATMVRYSNYSYEPSLGTRKGAGKENIDDYDVLAAVAGKISDIIEDVRLMGDEVLFKKSKGRIVADSFFNVGEYLEAETVDLVITSPPYLNNYHYIRNTRPQLYWLGFAEHAKDTKPLEHANFGTYWQTVRSKDRLDLAFKVPQSDLRERLEHLRTLNPEKGVYGGNGWANYAAAYFNDCYRLAEGMHYVMKPGATALIVVGNSILQGVDIATDRYLGEIAEVAGLELVDIHIPRQTRVGNSIITSDVRVGKAKKGKQLYEAVVEIRKPL